MSASTVRHSSVWLAFGVLLLMLVRPAAAQTGQFMPEQLREMILSVDEIGGDFRIMEDRAGDDGRTYLISVQRTAPDRAVMLTVLTEDLETPPEVVVREFAAGIASAAGSPNVQVGEPALIDRFDPPVWIATIVGLAANQPAIGYAAAWQHGPLLAAQLVLVSRSEQQVLTESLQFLDRQYEKLSNALGTGTIVGPTVAPSLPAAIPALPPPPAPPPAPTPAPTTRPGRR